MDLKGKERKFPLIRRGAQVVLTWLYCGLTCISPRWNTKARYRQVTGKKLNLANPGSFEEKLLWLKLNRYMKDPLVIRCADKYAVREYVAQVGCGDLLNELYGVYDTPGQIPWAQLPRKFVLKWNFGAGLNLVCDDKDKLDIPKEMKKLRKWEKSKPWLPHAEMQYKYAPKKIICEKFLEDPAGPGALPDYKVYCFHGEPKAVLVMHDRGRQVKTEFFDPQWNELENTAKYGGVEVATRPPACLDRMMEAARALSKPFPFVRCDFYVVGGKLYFGEMTFTPAAGLYVSKTKIEGKDMTEFLQVT